MGNPDLNPENFRSIVGAEGIVMVLCHAPNCGSCRAMEPAWKRLTERFPEHAFARLDTHAEAELAKFFELLHTPTLMLYRDGLLLLRKAAHFLEEELADMIGQTESLDMDRVRADLAEEDANPQ